MPTPTPGSESTVPEDVAHRILARAAEIEAREDSSVSLTRLREIAGEAGIAPAALERAVEEVLHPPQTRFQRAWSRLAAWFAAASPVNAVAALTTNVLAFATAWLIARAATRVAVLVGGGWIVSNGMLVLATLAGVGLAVRVRARLTAVLLAILAAAQLAEYPLHLIYGIGVVQGAATKWALLLAAGFGIMLSRLLTQRTTAHPTPTHLLPSQDESPESLRKDPDPEGTLLRLRIVPASVAG